MMDRPTAPNVEGRSSSALLFAPLNYTRVFQGVHRSAYPNHKTLPFVSALRLKSVMCLCPSIVQPELRIYCSHNNIHFEETDFGVNQEPFLTVNNARLNAAVDFVRGEYVRSFGDVSFFCCCWTGWTFFFLVASSRCLLVAISLAFCLIDPTNHPCLIFCTTGKMRTSLLVGCLRKAWLDLSLAYIFHEYYIFAQDESNAMDIQCIENF
jgi:tyrosine-protein phosphatase SIW14